MGQQLRGLVAQSMSGTRSSLTLPAYQYDSTLGTGAPTGSGSAGNWGTVTVGAGSLVIPASGTLHIFAWGPGGSSIAGGSAGGALYKKLLVTYGQALSWSIGDGVNDANGTATTVTLPDGRVLTATAGLSSGALPARPTSGDVNRLGGAGGTGTATAGEDGGGAAGGVNGGGGAAGFASIIGGLTYGQGNSGATSRAAPGAGTSSNAGSIKGGAGRLILIITQRG